MHAPPGTFAQAAGFDCSIVPLADGRPNLIARIGGSDRKAPLAFTGHTDTVPLGLKPWSVPTHDGLIKDGKVWGRGSCDMKGGVAAFVVAAIEMAPRLAGTPGVVLYITAGEETGLAGAMKLAEREMKGQAGALVVAEPTSNRPLCGHKGALWLKAITHGVTAHGSMPDQGVNAVYSAARAVTKLETFDFNVARHPIMGGATLNVGSFAGGINVNSVPDRAEIGIDIRTLPGMDHARLREQLASLLGPEVEFATHGRRQGRVDGSGPSVDARAFCGQRGNPRYRIEGRVGAVHHGCECADAGARRRADDHPRAGAGASRPSDGRVVRNRADRGSAADLRATDRELVRASVAAAGYPFRRASGWCSVTIFFRRSSRTWV